MIITREWAMPNSETFSIKPIGSLVKKYIKDAQVIVDPFARNSKFGTITNDLNPECNTLYHLDALDFLKMLTDSSADVVLFDPPYSPRQISEVYQNVGKQVNQQDTQTSFWSNCKTEISRILKPNGIALSFCWNTTGIGIKNGFEIIEILIVCHGSFKNDTLCTVERKIQSELLF